jgi:hypothetical protein
MQLCESFALVANENIKSHAFISALYLSDMRLAAQIWQK